MTPLVAVRARMGTAALTRALLVLVLSCLAQCRRISAARHMAVEAMDVSTVAASTVLAAKVQAAVQKVMDRLAAKYNASFGFGFVDASGSAMVAAGVDHRLTGEKLHTYTRVPLGSATKPWTATMLMQYVEKGKIRLTDPAYKWVDAVLTRSYKTTLAGMWGAKAHQITVGHLVSMQSGFEDYDDGQLEEWTVHHLHEDLDPIRYLKSAAGHGFHCNPGTCVKYSGANYVLLGFVLMELQGGKHWEDLDQMAVIPKSFRDHKKYNNTQFAKHGTCAHYKLISHQYNPGKHIDMRRASCLNGWTMGNIMTTGQDMAQFYYDLFGRAESGTGLLKAETLQQMLHFKTMEDDDWCFGADEEAGVCQYGFGLERNHLELDIWPMLDDTEAHDVQLIGHNGQNWGSGASPCGYNNKYKFGLCVTFTSNVALNRSISHEANEEGMGEVACRVYDAALTAVAGPRLDCSQWDLVTHDKSEHEYEIKRQKKLDETQARNRKMHKGAKAKAKAKSRAKSKAT